MCNLDTVRLLCEKHGLSERTMVSVIFNVLDFQTDVIFEKEHADKWQDFCDDLWNLMRREPYEKHQD